MPTKKKRYQPYQPPSRDYSDALAAPVVTAPLAVGDDVFGSCGVCKLFTRCHPQVLKFYPPYCFFVEEDDVQILRVHGVADSEIESDLQWRHNYDGEALPVPEIETQASPLECFADEFDVLMSD